MVPPVTDARIWPEPLREQHCDSAMLVYTAQAMAAALGMAAQELVDQTRRNACAVYRVDEESLRGQWCCWGPMPVYGRPLRGRRCDSAMLAYTALAMAAALGMAAQELVDRARRVRSVSDRREGSLSSKWTILIY